MKELPVLFENKAQCSGCGACVNICPAEAIAMQEDAEGFDYPCVAEDKCIRCYKCLAVCKK